MQNIIADHRPGYRSLDADAERLLSSFGDHLLREHLSDNRHASFLAGQQAVLLPGGLNVTQIIIT